MATKADRSARRSERRFAEGARVGVSGPIVGRSIEDMVLIYGPVSGTVAAGKPTLPMRTGIRLSTVEPHGRFSVTDAKPVA